MDNCNIEFYGSSTVGERGQIVIPQSAREKMKISHGDKYVFFGTESMLYLVKSNELDGLLGRMHAKITSKIEKIKQKVKEDNETN